MEEFEERMKGEQGKSKDKRDELIVMKDKEREVIGEESRGSGGSSSSGSGNGDQSSREEIKETRKREDGGEVAMEDSGEGVKRRRQM
eukprot:66540-Karenia_brevis.AAC.1